MPIIKSAIKKLRQDRNRTKRNDLLRMKVEAILRRAKKDKKKETVQEATSLIDKAAKHGIFHKNKAARMKSKISKLVAPTRKVSKKKVRKTK